MSTKINILKPREELEKTFERCTSDIIFKDAHLELATESIRSAIIELLEHHFYPDDVLNKSLQNVLDENIYQTWWNKMKDDLSLVLLSDQTREVIGVIVIALSRQEEKFDPSKCVNQKDRTIQQFLHHKSDEMDVFKKYGLETAVHFLALCVHKDFRGQGAATKLMKAALAFSKEIGLDPVCVTVECTSESSQRICEKFGFETLHTIYYNDYKVDGNVVFLNTGNNTSTKIYTKKI